MSKKLAFRLSSAFAFLILSVGASASLTANLQGGKSVANGDGSFTFNYDTVLSANGGLSTAPRGDLVNGSRFVIFDFAGYIDGTARSSSNLFQASVETVSPSSVKIFGEDDSDTLYNLVFTYIGAEDFNTAGGPYAPINYVFSAASRFGDTAYSSYSGVSVLNAGSGVAGTAAFDQGAVLAPRATVAAVPEASTWAMLMIGFGGLGSMMRRRNRHASHGFQTA